MLFSGDCAFDGSSQGLAVARHLLLEPLATLLPDRPIVLVPGNHDVERGAIDRLQEQGMRDLFLTHEAIGELLGDESACTQALRRLQAWREFHAEFYREHPPVEIPLLGHIHTSSSDGTSVGIAALNTAWRCSDDTDRGRLLVGEQQLRAAMSAISETELRFVVMHHPLEWLAEFDETLCRLMFEEARCFVFTGHDHKSDPAAATTARGSAVYSRAGCLYETRDYPNSYSLLELVPASKSAQAVVRRWWPGRDAFGVAEDLVEGGILPLPWPDAAAMLPAAAVPTERVLAADAPLLIAVDDVAPRDRRATERLMKFIAAHPEAHFILGCHESTHRAIVDAFPEGVEVERVFLRPLRRRDLRALVVRVYGAESSQLVQKVLAVLDSHRLPRNALNMAALVAVAASEPNLNEVNETGLFDAYVSLLLDSELVHEPDIGGMDRRLREGLLERLAYELLSRKVSRLAWPDAEQFVIDFFKSVGWSSGSPARLLESFIVRRVLIEDELGVGFRYGALRDLFAAKWMLSSEEFAREVRDDCLAFPDIIRHATGLRRNRPDLLELVGETVRRAAQHLTSSVELARFDTTGQLALNPLPPSLEDAEPAPSPTEEELDDLYDGLAPIPVEDNGEVRRIETGEGAVPAEVMAQMYSLLAAVLKNSELVEDIGLKARELREVIHGWSVLAMMITADTAMMRQLGDLLTPLLDELKSGQEETGEVAEQFASILILTLLNVGLEGRVGTPRLEAALIEVLENDEFMGTTLHALFSTLLYASLRLPGWAERVKALYEKHGRHPLVAALVTQWTLVRYRTDDFSDKTRGVLENVLADGLAPSGSADAPGPAAIVGRSRNRADVLEWLRRSRLLTQQRIKSLSEKDGTVEERESTGVIEQV